MTLDEARLLLGETAVTNHASRAAVVEALDRAGIEWPFTAHVTVLRNYTVEPLESFLKFAAYSRDMRVELSFGGYDTYAQDILDPSTKGLEPPLDGVVLSLWLDNLPMAFDGEGALQADAVITHLEQVIAALRRRVSCGVFLNTFLPAAHQLEDVYEPAGNAALHRLNAALRELAGRHASVFVIDFLALQSETGVQHARDSRYWFMFKAPLGTGLLAAWADALAQALAASRGAATKVVALDCDNTLWGGIVGEDGLEGIKLDPQEYPGSAFWVFQRQLLELHRRGVLLTLCSKNNEADVWEVFERHPHSVLRRHHFAGYRIDWRDKAANLRELAEELQLGLDAFLFIDDNPAEADRVRQALPTVDVLAVPQAPHGLPRLLAGYRRWAVARTSEDSLRPQQYEAERERRQVATAFDDPEAFLASLELVADTGPALRSEIGRVAQLTQKTNQFNLTTRRYTEQDILRFVDAREAEVLVLAARDKYGDYGLTGVAILVAEAAGCRIDTFLLSCRILGRHLEDVLLDEVVQRVKEKWGAREITSEFIGTAKNSQVADFYSRRQFECIAEGNGCRRYRLATDAYHPLRPAAVDVRRRQSGWKSE